MTVMTMTVMTIYLIFLYFPKKNGKTFENRNQIFVSLHQKCND